MYSCWFFYPHYYSLRYCFVCFGIDFFVEFSVIRELIYQSSHKKRKVIRDDPASQAEASSVPEKNEVIKKSGAKQYLPTRRPYSKAKQCLRSLLVSVESLHQKNLFPYKPNILLKRYVLFFFFFSLQIEDISGVLLKGRTNLPIKV